MKPKGRAAIFSSLTVIGLFAAFYSVGIKNYLLALISVVFAFVSFYNIFCGFKKKVK